MAADCDPAANAVTGTALSALAGLVGGPWLAALVGLACGLPVRLAAIGTGLAVWIWLDPVTGIWLAVTAVTGALAFWLGTIRNPPPGLGCLTRRDDGAQRIAQLQDRLDEYQARERALLAALTRTHHDHGSPAALPAPLIQGQVTG